MSDIIGTLGVIALFFGAVALLDLTVRALAVVSRI